MVRNPRFETRLAPADVTALGQTASALGEDDDKSGMKANKGIILKKSVEYIRCVFTYSLAKTGAETDLFAGEPDTCNNSSQLKRPGTRSSKPSLPK